MLRFLVVVTMLAAFVQPTLAQSKGNAAFVAKAKYSLTLNFKDPASVRYRNLAVYRQINGKELALCGEVNAKNSYGAYVGFVPFYADDSYSNMPENDQDSLFFTLRNANCYKRIETVK